MIANDRRTSHRRGPAFSSSGALGNALTMDRRGTSDRRRQPRRRSDLQTIDQYARAIAAGETHRDVILDGAHGLRLVADFGCGCSASEPVGAGKPSVCIEACATHTEPRVARDRRRKR
jgi:hypothetical protein